MKTIYYSVIIPHKNSPDLLQYCLDSIPIRDDVQVIVVDDNSDADKVDFGRFPQWKGENYECYLTKEGRGAGYARNVALEHARGKWVLFVDADDFLLPSIGDVFDAEKDTDADVVFYRPKAVMLEDRETPSKRADFLDVLIDLYKEKGDETPLRCGWEAPVSKLIKSDLIRAHGIRFDEIRYANDVLFMVSSGVLAKTIVYRDNSFYCITESAHSLASDFMKKPGELRIRTDAFFRAQKVVVENGYPLDEKRALDYLRKLFSDDREAFFVNFNRMRKMGYSKKTLVRELFKGNNKKSRMKRAVYVYFVTTWRKQASFNTTK
jgi:glycosyltransferase involved in cell wall biosynthesis